MRGRGQGEGGGDERLICRSVCTAPGVFSHSGKTHKRGASGGDEW